ncbi:AAA family ATPase [Nocardia arthritidis]|uniref:MinD/ParA family ATP-binding protein n=1 Tax=Nocardia arthritidis TaxID=228602 RepID=UPI003D160ADC
MSGGDQPGPHGPVSQGTPTGYVPGSDQSSPHGPSNQGAPTGYAPGSDQPGPHGPGNQGAPTGYVPGSDQPGPHGPSNQGAPTGYAPGSDQPGPHGPGSQGAPTGYAPTSDQAGPVGQAPGGGQPGGHYAPGETSGAAAGYGPTPPYAPGPDQQGQYGPHVQSVPGLGPATGGFRAGQYPQGPQYQQGPPPSLDDVPMRRATKAPGSGWRKAVHHASRGAINPGMSAEERRLQELVARIRQPVRGDYRIAVLSLKGGVGKTTTTMGLGSTFASIRGDRVIAVDANPDFGTLSQRVPLQTRSTVRDLLLDPAIQRYSDVRRHTSQSTSRLEVLASERDPAASEAFSEEEYRAVARILQRFYNIILTDCGTGLMHSAMSGVLDLAHSLVLISSPAIDGARSAAATLDWLSLHGHDHLVRNAVVVINSPRAGSPNVGIQQLREYFLSRCRAVHIIPFDPHMSEGAEIDLHRLNKTTKRAYVELAATVADDFATDHRRNWS